MAPRILIIGATGFIGSHLLREFENLKTPIRVMARSTSKVITSEITTEVVFGDLDKKESLKDCLEGIESIYYLAHAMGDDSNDFVAQEIAQAQNLSNYLLPSQKVIYLSGIIPDEELSDHLKARENVGKVLISSKANTVEFRASIVIGDGSASFEIVRAIINKLPVIVSADWSKAKCQPIALKNVLEYLMAASDKKFSLKNSIYNIAGTDSIMYEELLTRYASYKKFYRPNIFIPKFPKEVALEVLKYVAMEHYQVGSRLLESIEHETILEDDKAQNEFNIKLLSLEESFNELDDTSSSVYQIGDFFESNITKELPQYLVGESIQIFIPLINKSLEQFLSTKAPVLKSINFSIEDLLSNESYDLRIPKVGHFKFTYNKAKSGLHLVIKPEYFFQSLGISILKKILS